MSAIPPVRLTPFRRKTAAAAAPVRKVGSVPGWERDGQAEECSGADFDAEYYDELDHQRGHGPFM